MTTRHEDSSAKKHDQWSSKNKKGTCPVLILATDRHTTESVENCYTIITFLLRVYPLTCN